MSQTDEYIFYCISAICIIWLWIGLYFWMKNSYLKYSPLYRKDLKTKWITVYGTIMSMGMDWGPTDLIDLELPIHKYLILEIINNEWEKKLRKMYYGDFLNYNNIFSLKVLKQFKIGDSIKCHVDKYDYSQIYIDPDDVLTPSKCYNKTSFITRILYLIAKRS